MATDSGHKECTKSGQAKKKKLTLKQKLFCYAYIKNLGNATQSAKDAGFSVKTAYSSGQRLLKDVEILAEITRLKEKLLDKSEKTAQDIINELDSVAFARITDVAGWNESGVTFLKNSDDLEPEVAGTIESIEVTEDYVKGEKNDKEGRVVLKSKLKMHSKLQALKLRAQIEGLLKEGPTLELPKDITINLNFSGEKDGDKR